jgi:hypothetical protein
MPSKLFLPGFAVFILLALSSPAQAAGPTGEQLVDQVKKAIDRGIQFLRDQERDQGDGSSNWDVDAKDSLNNRGGWTSLALLALLNAGVKPDDPIIDRGLKHLRGIDPEQTYVVGLQTMVFAAAGRAEDKVRIQRNVDWLIKTRCMNGGQLSGWGYGPGSKVLFGDNSDNSNTQYALLGLHEGHLAGAKIDKDIWQSIQDYYIRTQRIDTQGNGGWGYSPIFLANAPTLTMTVGGLCGLIIAGQELNKGREVLQPNGTATNCGRYSENDNINAALGWIGSRFRFSQARREGWISQGDVIFYNLYGIERAGRLTGLRFLGDHDWYREGCRYLVDTQDRESGYWEGKGRDQWRVISTSFALLFLSKGRTPILISKLVHGSGDDWNNDHNDARNLVSFAGQELFQRMPLAWQIFDAKRGLGENTRDEMLGVVGDLMQSPVAYFNGHQSPRFTSGEEEVLREYVDQGGFILAEACCGRPEFDQGFRDLMKKLFPDTPLKPLPAEHAIWKSHFLVKPGEFPLEGIDRGCKTVVVYSPHDLSCLWESDQHENGKGLVAFRLGANIIAYATGMEPPKPRLTPTHVVRDDGEGNKVPRGHLKVVQLRHEGDWQPAPRAMRNLMAHLQDVPRLPVALKTEAINPAQQGIFDFKFMYLHGRNSFDYASDGQALDNLRANLQTGGLLFADACCGKKAFDTSFRDLVSKLFPGKELQPIPPGDELYSKELNGTAITSVRCRREQGGDGYREVPPFLEGLKINNRWVIIYSKYDVGCALEKHQSSDCMGHDYDSALRLGMAAVLYALKR